MKVIASPLMTRIPPFVLVVLTPTRLSTELSDPISFARSLSAVTITEWFSTTPISSSFATIVLVQPTVRMASRKVMG